MNKSEPFVILARATTTSKGMLHIWWKTS